MAKTEGNVLAEVTEIVRAYFCIGPERNLGPETHLRNDLGADSLDEAEIALQLEDRFGIQIPDDVNAPTIQEIALGILRILAATGKERTA